MWLQLLQIYVSHELPAATAALIIVRVKLCGKLQGKPLKSLPQKYGCVAIGISKLGGLDTNSASISASDGSRYSESLAVLVVMLTRLACTEW